MSEPAALDLAAHVQKACEHIYARYNGYWPTESERSRIVCAIEPLVDELERCRAERDRLSTKLQAQIEYTKIEYGSCGGLDWTIEKWGRITHKHACLDRHDAWCQTHPEGCPEDALGEVTR